MIKCCNPVNTLLLLGMFFVSCNGQVKTNMNSDEPKKARPKLIRSLGTDKHQNVHCGLQDKTGNLWFGTTGEGVYRYDGTSFINFTMKDGLNSNTIWSVLEDKNGNIWFGTADGICRYDGKAFARVSIPAMTGSYFQTNNSPDNPSAKNAVWSIMQDKSGKLWFGTDFGLYCYNQKTFTRFLDDHTIINKEGLGLKSVQCMLQDKNGNIWLGSGVAESEGLCLFDGKSLTRFKPNGDGWIRSILEDKKGNLWLACRFHGLAFYDVRLNEKAGQQKTFVNFTEKEGLSENGAGTLMEDKSGNIWFAAEKANVPENEKGGLWLYDGHLEEKAGQKKSFKNFTVKDGLVNNAIWCILEDKAGHLWIGSRDMGLCRYDGKTFTRFSE
ncbi:hypothetical protein GVN16_07345 [Emticicia sp. CRIBPO]|uniref:ligand-binding sensor domain-containing protein n=1 Tax=Emticicia sp. CRIBPO TaxID=2683258 RepID=UPI00141300D7|nr:two-component regulator propeller domain-containing protein [Emticicia sp. CRIBPO]NBA85569.1 hypothetical protein [Emticicia sp. CRIBPO]